MSVLFLGCKAVETTTWMIAASLVYKEICRKIRNQKFAMTEKISHENQFTIQVSQTPQNQK